MAAATIAATGDVANLPRPLLEQVRDRLDRAQERAQFSSDEDQQNLVEVIAALDEIRGQVPTN